LTTPSNFNLQHSIPKKKNLKILSLKIPSPSFPPPNLYEIIKKIITKNKKKEKKRKTCMKLPELDENTTLAITPVVIFLG
jgi:hypothetical protein